MRAEVSRRIPLGPQRLNQLVDFIANRRDLADGDYWCRFHSDD